jgi:hypothetical protein
MPVLPNGMSMKLVQGGWYACLLEELSAMGMEDFVLERIASGRLQ